MPGDSTPGLSGGEGITPRAVVSVQRWSLFDKTTTGNEALQAAGLDESRYCSHSFHIGAATAAAARGMEDSVIKTLGRWRSLAYLDYVKIPQDQLAGYSRLIAA